MARKPLQSKIQFKLTKPQSGLLTQIVEKLLDPSHEISPTPLKCGSAILQRDNLITLIEVRTKELAEQNALSRNEAFGEKFFLETVRLTKENIIEKWDDAFAKAVKGHQLTETQLTNAGLDPIDMVLAQRMPGTVNWREFSHERNNLTWVDGLSNRVQPATPAQQSSSFVAGQELNRRTQAALQDGAATGQTASEPFDLYKTLENGLREKRHPSDFTVSNTQPPPDVTANAPQQSAKHFTNIEYLNALGASDFTTSYTPPAKRTWSNRHTAEQQNGWERG